jgi:hypothetical protein
VRPIYETYITVQRGQGARVSPGLTETLAAVGHLGNSLVRASTLDTRVQNVADSTTEPVSTLVTGRASAVLDQSGSRARGSEHRDGGNLHDCEEEKRIE